MTIGQSMRAARKKAKLSLRALSKLSGIYVTAICDYENDKRNPPISTVEILADALSISIDEYIGHKVRGGVGNA